MSHSLPLCISHNSLEPRSIQFELIRLDKHKICTCKIWTINRSRSPSFTYGSHSCKREKPSSNGSFFFHPVNVKYSVAFKIRQMAEKCIVLMNLIIIIPVCGVNAMPSLINLKTSKPNVVTARTTTHTQKNSS